MSPAIESRKRQLDEYFDRASRQSDEIQSDLARHGVVLICGFIERSVELIVLEKVQKKAHPRIVKFVKDHFQRGTNYTCEVICQLFERFDLSWSEKFRAFMKSRDDLVQAVSSAYALRNPIAHGGSGSPGLGGVRKLYASAIEVVEAMALCTR